MANLRLISFAVIDSTHLSAKFNSVLSPLISTDNISISSETDGVQNPIVLNVDIIEDSIIIATQPLVSRAAYTVTFINTDSVLFKSINSNFIILNDGITNKQFFIGPVEISNPIKDSIFKILEKNVYDLESPSIISKYIDNLSGILSKALYDIGQTKNDNYLSFTIIDELKTRGNGAYDRLNQEGAYDIIRVAKTATSAKLSETITNDEFPTYPISLLSTNIIETFIPSNSDSINSFNLKTLTLNCAKFPVIILNSVRFIYDSVLSPFDYDTTLYGYQIQDSDYDPSFAFTYLLLENNQFKLSDKVLSNPLFSLENIASIVVNYQYKDQGKVIDASSLSLNVSISSGRESLPPIENTFNLKNGPIVNINNIDGKIGDLVFLDPNAYPGSNSPHPAFIYEIPFRLDYLPARIGEYSVDYLTGTVYVFGQDANKNGTGAYPPLALYYYRYIFQSEIDYVYDEISSDLISLSNGNLEGSSVNISYNFEQVLVKDVDYICEVHKEELSERIENRLVALNVLKPLNFPITNVFRIFNETSGEIYRVSRWNNNKIFFDYQTPPKILDSFSEKANFEDIINETLFVSSTIPISDSLSLYFLTSEESNILTTEANDSLLTESSTYTQIFKIFLQNNNIMASSEDAIGYFKNSSLFFSDTTIFISELYYDTLTTEDQNNLKLINIGDYQVDYENGIIWVVVPTTQDLSIGSVSYKRGYIKTQNPHIITVNDLYYKLTLLSDKYKTFKYISFDNTLILPESFDKSNESILNGNKTLPYQLYSGEVGVFESAIFIPGVTDYIKYLRGIFEKEDISNSSFPINFASSATFNGKTISVSSLNYQEYQSVQQEGIDYVIYLNTNLLYLSSNITINMSVIRLSDSAQLWDGSGVISTGSPFKITLSGVNSPVIGDSVLITYSFEINDLSTVVIDYSRGDYLIDYSYLADEIILSYEYGDNILNFSKSTSIEPGDNYFVSYRTGALRNALLRNFGTLIDIPILNNLNVDFNRERYRDALTAAMQSFTNGPTLASLKNIVQEITHVPPEIIESAFNSWDLGTSILSPQKIDTTGSLELLPAKYGNGVLVSDPGQSLSFPIISNLRIEEGTIGMWVVPQWNGIDNQADLTFEITRDGYSDLNQNKYFVRDGHAISDQDIFIGPGEDHPISKDGIFSVSNISVGIPNKNKDGIYIYLFPDNSNLFNRWYIDIVDGYSDGYVANNLSIKITTSGKFYDIKKSALSITNNGIISSGSNKLTYKILNSISINEGITFTADYEHYLFDFGNPPEISYNKLRTITNLSSALITEAGDVLVTELGELLII